MMIITATELKSNIGKYLLLADSEEIFVTKNGKSIAKLTNVREDKIAALHALRGIIKDKDAKLSEIRTERLEKYRENIN